MWKVFREELKACILNWKLVAGVLIIFTVSWAVSYPFYQQIIEGSNIGSDPAWAALFRYCLFSETALLAVPIAAPLAAGELAEGELHSRFALFSAFRSGKKRYPAGKVFGLFISGGLIVCLGQAVLLISYFAALMGIPLVQEHSASYSVLALLMDFVRSFLNGGLWAVLGGLAAVISKNHYMSYAVPFILYYVLSVFQERYYSKLYALSPRYWSYPMHFGNIGCILILMAALITVGVIFMIAIKRRLEHV